MNADFGPFSVDPAQVGGLTGGLFQDIANRLLDVEMASARLSGMNLHTSYRENVGDEGVDAALYSAQPTEWVPEGSSAWQFKAGDLSPSKCATEFEGATRAQEIVRKGGSYRLVLGKSLEDGQIARREEALRNKANELDIDFSEDTFRVIAGGRLATWVERHPQLAVSRSIGGVGEVAVGFDTWQRSARHQTKWVASSQRDELRTSILGFLEGRAELDLRIEGGSGLGKTRGVLESLRNSNYESLVLYVPDADDLTYPLLNHLTVNQRAAVVVVDECSRRKHNTLAEQLVHDGTVRLVTIGERDASLTRSMVREVGSLPNDIIDSILSTNKQNLWPEARRVVVENCAGNITWALRVADLVMQDPSMSVGTLIGEDLVHAFIGDLPNDDARFLAACALALFSRYGVDQDMRGELEQISAGLDIPLEDLDAANRRLANLNLLTRHGRYRSVSPQPVAVYLATRAWRDLGERIVTSLLPGLEPSLAERLFLRAADLGSNGPASAALARILAEDGPFRSLEAMAEGSASQLLTSLAIINPEEVTRHLERLIETATDQELTELKSIRRNLVWTLEKLAWHSVTFRTAADLLLRLAICENETWANNSSSTWVSLFGVMLPGTSASSESRMKYLEGLVHHNNAAVRKLVARAASGAIQLQGTIMVYGELQGGAVVEPRGRPNTWDEAWAYLRGAIDALHTLAGDSDSEVRTSAQRGLVGAIHGFLELSEVRESLFEALADLPPDGLLMVRTETQHLHALFTRVQRSEFASDTGSGADLAARQAGLDRLRERLPEPSPPEELELLASANRWEWEDGGLQAEILRIARLLPTDDARKILVQLVSSRDNPSASFEIGAALYSIARSVETERILASIADNGNVPPLVGYLHAAISAGETDAFDAFLTSEVGEALQPAARLAVTVRGPQSDAGWSRIVELQRMVPVHIGAPGIFGWHGAVDEAHLGDMLEEWISRLASQLDYNALVGTIAMMVHGRPPLSENNEAKIGSIVERRSQYADVGQQAWDWVQLARRQLAYNADGLLSMLIQQIDAGTLQAFMGGEEQRLLASAVSAAGSTTLDRILGLIAGSWRLEMDLRGWFADLYPASDVTAWVGDDVERAKLVAVLSGVPDGPPSTTVRYLLDHFGGDQDIASRVSANYIAGGWSGNESDRLTNKIAILEDWIHDRDQPAGVKEWARRVVTRLEDRRRAVLLRESEERFR